MKRFIALCLAISIIQITYIPTSNAAYFGKIQLDFLPIATNLGEPKIDQKQIEDLVVDVDRNFNYLTGGLARFELRNIFELQHYGRRIIESSELRKKFPKYSLQPDKNYKEAILIGVIPKDDTYVFAGNSNGSENQILLNGLSENESIVEILVHEIGHSFNLDHANSMACKNNDFSQCEIKEYGDSSDVMGNLNSHFRKNNPIYQFSLHRYAQLDLLKQSDILEVTKEGEYQINSAFPISEIGPKLIYLGVAKRRAIAIEWRPARGNDSTLSQSLIAIEGSNGFYENIPSYGLQVRFVGGEDSEVSKNLPNIKLNQTAIYVNSLNDRQGIDAGQFLELPNGLIISVLSSDLQSAKIKISDPKKVLSTITKKSLSLAPCDASRCIEGRTWEPLKGLMWSAKLSNLYFQEKINNKWVVLKKVPPVKIYTGKYKWGYPFEISVGKPGTHVYRYYIPKSGGYLANAGKPFIQKVYKIPNPTFVDESKL